MIYLKNRLGVIKAIIILVASFLLGLFPTERVTACSCVAPGTPEEELNRSTAVFTGTVTKISQRNVPVDELNAPGYFRPMVQIEVNVYHSWKGVTTDFVYLHTGAGGGDCGFPISASETYLFYALGPLDDLNISICSRTALDREAQEDRDYLVQLPELALTHVVPQNVPIENKEPGANILLVGTTIVLLVIVSYLIVKNQQMRKKHDQ